MRFDRSRRATSVIPEVAANFPLLTSAQPVLHQKGRRRRERSRRTGAVKGRTGTDDITGASRENCAINLEETSQRGGGKVGPTSSFQTAQPAEQDRAGINAKC